MLTWPKIPKGLPITTGFIYMNYWLASLKDKISNFLPETGLGATRKLLFCFFPKSYGNAEIT